MKITEISVGYGETQSLPEYSNVKPALTLTATIDADEDAAVAEAALWELVKQSVHAQVDLALERNDRPAKYDLCPRFQVLCTYWDRWAHPKDTPEPPKIVVVLPSALELSEVGGVRRVSCGNLSDSRRLRYAHALRVARQEATERDADLLDCSDGDLGRLETALPAPTPLSEEDAAGIRDADDREDDRAQDDEDDDDRRPDDDEESDDAD